MLHWSISHSSLETSTIRGNLASAKERQFRAWNFPANISGHEEMEVWWNALDFGGQKGAASPLNVCDAVGVSNDVVADKGSSHVATEGADGLIEEEDPEANGDRIQQP